MKGHRPCASNTGRWRMCGPSPLGSGSINVCWELETTYQDYSLRSTEHMCRRRRCRMAGGSGQFFEVERAAPDAAWGVRIPFQSVTSSADRRAVPDSPATPDATTPAASVRRRRRLRHGAGDVAAQQWPCLSRVDWPHNRHQSSYNSRVFEWVGRTLLVS